MEEFWFIAIITSLIIGLIPASIANGKGKDFFTWYLYGVLLFFFAMIHAIVLPEKSSSEHLSAQDIKKGRISVKEIPKPNIYKDPLLVDLNSPVELASYDIVIPQDTDKAYANIRLLNLSDKKITAIKLKILCFDSFNEPVNFGSNVIEKSLQDLDCKPKRYFADDILIDLVDLVDTRKIKVVVLSILFNDNSRWNYKEENIIEVNTNLAEGEELLNLKQIVGKDAICYTQTEQSFWQCVCGKANILDDEECVRCKRVKENIVAYSNPENIIFALRRIKEQEKADKQFLYEQKDNLQENVEKHIKLPLILGIAAIISFLLLGYSAQIDFDLLFGIGFILFIVLSITSFIKLIQSLKRYKPYKFYIKVANKIGIAAIISLILSFGFIQIAFDLTLYGFILSIALSIAGLILLLLCMKGLKTLNHIEIVWLAVTYCVLFVSWSLIIVIISIRG